MPSRTTPKQAAAILRRKAPFTPSLAMVLGSGFSDVVSSMAIEREVPLKALPGFPMPAIAGHQGRLVFGRLGSTPLLALCGRSHYYEGHSLQEITFPIRALAALGIRSLLLTNAAGGINRRFRPGDFMALADHINLMGANPLRGPVEPGRERFVDLSAAYDAGLRGLLKKAAKSSGARLHSGVYLAVSGPSYETPAEIRAFARMGADAVGMSTVPEVIVARQCGLAVAAVSCITNPAAGLGRDSLSHDDVLKTGAAAKARAAALLTEFARLYARHHPATTDG